MNKIFDILRTKTIRHSAINFSGTLINGFLGVFFYIVMARFLGPEKYGVFSIAILSLTLISDIGNVGVDTGIIRFVGEYATKDFKKALSFLKLAFETKVVISLLIITLGWFLVPFITLTVFKKPELILPLRIALFGCSSILLFSFIINGFTAFQNYLVSNLLSIGSNAFRLGLIFIFFVVGLLSVNSSLIIYSVSPFVGFLVGILLIPNFFGAKPEGNIKTIFLDYNKWVALFAAIAALSSRLDSFISARFLTLNEVGIYSVAVSLSGIVPQIVYALGTVVAPKLASFDTKAKLINYFKKLQLFVFGLCIAGLILGIPLAYFVIPHFYGIGYIQSIKPFIILLIAQAIFLFSVPIHMTIIYYFSYPKLFAIVETFHTIFIFIASWLLVGKFGYMGAAYAVLFGNIFNFVVPAIWVARRLSYSER